jgi:hypothetical protein
MLTRAPRTQKAPQIYKISRKHVLPTPLKYINEVKSIIFSSRGDEHVAKSSNFASNFTSFINHFYQKEK